MSIKAFQFRQSLQGGQIVLQRTAIIPDYTALFLEVGYGERRKKPCAPPGRQNMTGAGHVIARGDRAVSAQKDRAGVFYPFKNVLRGFCHDLQVFGSDPVDRKSTRLNSSHIPLSRMPSSA